jgi:hypothetical protein
LERVFGRVWVVCWRGCISQPSILFLVVLLKVEDSHFTVIVISFQKSTNATSDAMLAVITSCFTPAARAVSRMRVVPETADYREFSGGQREYDNVDQV